jgi:hypothetical protein
VVSVNYIKKEFDNLLIVSTLAKIAWEDFSGLNEKENYILEALKRANPELNDKNLDEISDYLQTMNDSQLMGISNNVKGILHEIQFVEVENSDGDSVSAAMFTNTNHAGTDIFLTDSNTGEITEIQIKATDNQAYIQDWIDEHPDGEILVTREIADKMNLKTTGQSNEELTTDVNDFVEKLLELDNGDSLWDYFPGLPAISISIASFKLFQLYRKGEISMETFKIKFLKLTGMKVIKFSIIAALMMVPVVNVVVGAGLMFQLLYGTGTIANKYVS